jgi:periplasmic divalent cation tolerance protein
VLTTAPDGETARRIASHLVEYRLAACVNLIAGVESVYHWKGEVQRDTEVLLVIKTTRRAYPDLQKTLVELHPYELPEVLAVSPATGLPDYLGWIATSVENNP